MENQPFVFIKPHAFDNRKTMDFIDSHFEGHKISWLKRGVITGAQIRAGNLVDRHYSVNARVGTVRDPSTLDIGEGGRAKFHECFGEDWDAVIAKNRMVSGLVLQEQLDGSAEKADAAWSASSKRTKVAGGHYVARSEALNLYILNGFYPVVREGYMADEASIAYGIITFSSDDLNWKAFRHEVIGVTNPAQADKNSVRGYLFEHAEEFGLTVNNGDNVIHASASPFEALIEKNLWLAAYDPAGDPLYALLNAAGIGMADLLREYAANSVVTLNSGETGTLLDVLEDKNTDQVADILIQRCRK